ncbi:ankyrin repeat domain-containing protein [Legionella clemsonensis]|uniref:Ankyrin repeat protein n=1 Tax=Legionella clemsonensis TaxID=1867846 RepID=A0A222P578_9GAMM|nr:ankyrin repeat domain-containing protein [Legionella clemsonensis]ASQ47000.1 Ankyrin repeat protein [Legionella clemsonensis]
MVSCGKDLVGDLSNDSVIDLLLKHGADINSADKKGMTALHYAVQNFYNYRK